MTQKIMQTLGPSAQGRQRRSVTWADKQKKNSQIGEDPAHLDSQAVAPLCAVLMHPIPSFVHWCTLSMSNL